MKGKGKREKEEEGASLLLTILHSLFRSLLTIP